MKITYRFIEEELVGLLGSRIVEDCTRDIRPDCRVVIPHLQSGIMGVGSRVITLDIDEKRIVRNRLIFSECEVIGKPRCSGCLTEEQFICIIGVSAKNISRDNRSHRGYYRRG